MSGLLQLVCKHETEPCCVCGELVKGGKVAFYQYDMDAHTYKTWHVSCDPKTRKV